MVRAEIHGLSEIVLLVVVLVTEVLHHQLRVELTHELKVTTVEISGELGVRLGQDLMEEGVERDRVVREAGEDGLEDVILLTTVTVLQHNVGQHTTVQIYQCPHPRHQAGEFCHM